MQVVSEYLALLKGLHKFFLTKMLGLFRQVLRAIDGKPHMDRVAYYSKIQLTSSNSSIYMYKLSKYIWKYVSKQFLTNKC